MRNNNNDEKTKKKTTDTCEKEQNNKNRHAYQFTGLVQYTHKPHRDVLGDFQRVEKSICFLNFFIYSSSIEIVPKKLYTIVYIIKFEFN